MAGVAGCTLCAAVLLLAGPFAPTPVFRAPPAQAAGIVSAALLSPVVAAATVGPAAVSPLPPPPAVAGTRARPEFTGTTGRPVHPVTRKRGSQMIVTRPLPAMPIIPPYRPPPPQGEAPAPAGALPLDTEPLATPLGSDAAI